METQPHIDRRFERLGRLIAEDGVRVLHRAHVMVCGMGGVGSWAAEALARSGVGRLTLVDFDNVSITTLNRQLPGQEDTLGFPKVDVIADRARRINPAIRVDALRTRVNPDSLPELLAERPDFVVDAIDQLGNKAALLVHCSRNNIPIVASMGAGGKLDPTKICVSDLAETRIDPLAYWVRSYLRRRHGFPREGLFGIPAVYSMEVPKPSLSPTHPEAERGKTEIDEVPEIPGDDPRRLTSDMRNVILGTACFVTSVFGMTCASVVVREILRKAKAPVW